MADDRHPMTVQSHQLLHAELKQLKTIDRPAAAKNIETARAHGDLSENAEYDAAKEAQGMLEARLRIVEARLSGAQVVDVTTLSGDKVLFGATVKVSDADTGDEKVYVIVGEDEADAERGFISYQSPIARALIGKSIDDVVTVRLPSGSKDYEILEVDFVVPNPDVKIES